jgi:hypothetical protein
VPQFGPGTQTAASFSLDGAPSTLFTDGLTKDTSTPYKYNVTAFRADALPNSRHTLIFQVQGGMIMFDYATYE